MGPRTNSRRLSLDLIQRAVSDLSSDSILKYMDLRLPHSHSSRNHEVSEVECECCGLAEYCTHGYANRIRDSFHGRWVCGLCSEAVKEEHARLGGGGLAAGRHLMVREEALSAHMDACKRFNGIMRKNPAKWLAAAMADILKKSSKKRGNGGGDTGRRREYCTVSRSYSDIP